MPKKLEIKKIVLTGNLSSGSAVITNLSSTSSLAVGDLVFGTGIPTTTRILTKDSSTQITLDKNATSGGTGVTLTFATDDILVKNSDLLDGYHASVTTSPSTIAVRDSSENIAAKSANLLWLDFAVNPGTIIETAGRVYYNNEDDTLNIVHASGAVQSVGQEFFFPPTNNNSGVQINNGEFVMATGAVGDRITIAKAVTNGTVDYIYMIGVATKNIPNGSESGKIITAGLIRNFNTNAWTVGTVLYPNPSVAGGWTSTKPSAPAIKTPIAIVVRQNSSSGVLYVRMTLGSKLGDTDSNVEFTSLADKQMFAYNGTNTRWENTNGLSWDFANGRLGIGTSSPDDILVVSRTVSSNTGQIRFGGSNGRTLSAYNNGSLANFDFNAVQTYFNSDFLLNDVKTIKTANGNTGNLRLSTDSATAKVQVLTNLQVDGNSGFGVTSPTEKIDVSGTVKATAFSGSGASLTSLNAGNFGSGTLSSTYGGTGVNNGGRTLTIATGNITLTAQSGGSSVTLPASGTLVANPMTTLGDVIYGGASGAPTRLAGNTTTTKQFLSQTGTSSASAAPVWSAVSKSDVGLANVENTALSTWAGSTNITTLGTIATGTWSASTIGVSRGGTGQTTYTNGQLLIGNTTGNTLTKATLTAGSGISITNGAGSITISAAVTGLNEITVTNDAVGDIPLIVNAITGTTNWLQSWRVNGGQVAGINPSGAFSAVNVSAGSYVFTPSVFYDTDLTLSSQENDIRLYPYDSGVYFNDVLGFNTLGEMVAPISLFLNYSTTPLARITGNSLTSGDGLLIQSSSSSLTGSLLDVILTGAVTSGDAAKFEANSFIGSSTTGLVDILSTSTARASGSSLLNISSSGANTNSSREVRGASLSVTNTGTTSTNTALYLNASGATTNRAINVNSGEIYHNFSATGQTAQRFNGQNFDVTIQRIALDAATELGSFGYSLKYLGAGTGEANYLSMFADNQNAGTQNLAYRIGQSGAIETGGTLTVGTTLTHSGLVTTSGTNIDQIKEFTTASTTWTTTWQDITTVAGTYLATGSHTVLALLSGEYYTGTLSWFSGSTSTTTTDEIVLQRAGPAGSAARLFLRVARKTSGVLTLQASTSASITAAITLKFRRLI